MTPKTLGMAAILAALCLMPAASANTPNDPWGPDVTVYVTGSLCTTEFDLADTLGPSVHADANVHSEDCTQTVTYDADNVKAICGFADSTPPYLHPRVVVYRDCDVDVFV
jgi:hypothetical protein